MGERNTSSRAIFFPTRSIIQHMRITKSGVLLLVLLGLTHAAVGILAVLNSSPEADPLGVLVRLSALLGFLALATATAMTPFLTTIPRLFGRAFITVHHYFAAFGTVMVTLHPVAFAVRLLDPTVFIPVTDSWEGFWAAAGRPSLILIYIAITAALLRTRWSRWRHAHALMYAALVLAIVHANLIGSDLGGPAIWLILHLAFAAAVVALLLNTRRRWKQKGRKPGPPAPA